MASPDARAASIAPSRTGQQKERWRKETGRRDESMPSRAAFSRVAHLKNPVWHREHSQVRDETILRMLRTTGCDIAGCLLRNIPH